ncbi:hypothetical protein MY3296_009625 [Beauveria thailandica]
MKDDENATVEMQKIKLEDGINGVAAAHHAELTTAAMTDATKGIKLESSRSPSTEGAKSRTDGNGTPSSSRPRLSRKSSRKATPTREPPLLDHLPDMTFEACKSFQVISDCLYGSKHLGSTENDAFDCDCREEWQDGVNMACGEDSDCINRATKMECSESAGNCGGGCQNQRFQRKHYADVSVIKTDKKGYGLRTDADLAANDFIFEYIGEVINEATFRRRMLQYDHEGIKHFYFMSLNKNEFVDATRKGNLGRFCNHSCVPNCYVDKWVVGDKLRMGIFALRAVSAGEELVFNYNVDRYGADPQPCYCGEPNCLRFIGGKTQTERATKLPPATIEALGIDVGDGWDTTVAKKARKKRADEDDEDYVSSLQARPLDEEDSRKVMATLMQCKEKWIAVRLLDRIQQSDDERVIHSVMRMHAYQIFKTTLHTFSDDHNVVLQVLSILDGFPRLTRNKIQDSNIEATVEELSTSEHQDVASKSKKLLDDWSKLELAYRIRRRKFEPGMQTQSIYEDRRGPAREGDAAAVTQTPQNKAASQPINAPKGPRSNIPQRNGNFQAGNSARQRQRFGNNGPLPQGWFSAKDAGGNMYYYDKQGTTTWQRPTLPADQTPKVPSKAQQEQLMIQNIIARVTKEGTPKSSTSQQSQSSETPNKDSRSDKWRALSRDKQMKIYENTVFPHIKYVLDKFRHKLPKDDLKRLGKELSKKLVASDYKNSRVADPTAKLHEKQARKIKTYVKDFLDRAVHKYEAQKKEQGATGETGGSTANATTDLSGAADDKGDDAELSDMDMDDSPASRKRKHDDVADTELPDATPPADGPEMKRLKEDEVGAAAAAAAAMPSPPPPPPPPPQDEGAELTEEQQALREQERALERENEEAQRLEDEAARTNGEQQQEQEQNRKQEVLSH